LFVPYGRRLVSAGRAGGARAIAYVIRHGRRLAAEWGRLRTENGHEGRRALQRPRPAELRSRAAQIVKEWPAEEHDRGEYVSLTDLFDEDDRERQYQP
jgi:hypothetical protein